MDLLDYHKHHTICPVRDQIVHWEILKRHNKKMCLYKIGFF